MFLVHAGIGFVLGAFFPGVLRKIRAYFQKEAALGKAAIVDIKDKL